MTVLTRPITLRAFAVSLILVAACREPPAPDESNKANLSASAMGTASSPHGTSILQPSSDTTIYVYPSQIPSYAINSDAEFWLNGTFSGYGPGTAWNREIGWRSCSSNAPRTALYSASTPIFPDQLYNQRYTQQVSFTPGAYGQYEVASKSILYKCAGFCTDADSVRSLRCVTLADFSAAISGPSSVYADRTVTWTGIPSGGASPLTYQWYQDGVPSGNAQSITLNTGSTSFELRVDITDANSETRSATQLITVQLAPPTNCQLTFIPPPANYLKVTWANSGDAGVSTEVQIQSNGSWTTVATVDPGITEYYYSLGGQTGLFYGRVRHLKSGYDASAYCTTGSVTV